MVKQVHIPLDEDEFLALQQTKGKQTWRQFILHGAELIEAQRGAQEGQSDE